MWPTHPLASSAMTRTGTPTRARSAYELARPGPYGVLHGDLGVVGIPGEVFTPESGSGLPAVAFGHGLLQPTQRYTELLRHLASWGVVVAAPGTQYGLVPSFREFVADLRATVDVCVGVRLGNGDVTVDPDRLGLAGHGMGGGCAVVAAAAEERCAAVVTLALAEVLPSAVQAAHQISVPGLHLAAGQDLVATPVGHALPVAKVWAGPVQLRTLPKANHLGFVQGGHWSDLLLHGGPEHATRWITRTLVTAFLLRHLTGATEYDELLESALRGTTLDLLP